MNEIPEPRPGAKMPLRTRLRPWMAALAGGIAGALVVVLVEPSFIHLRGDPAAAHTAPPSAVVSLIPGPAGPTGPAGPAGAPGPATAATALAAPRPTAIGAVSVVGAAAPPPSHLALPATALPSPSAVVGSLPKPPVATPELPVPPAVTALDVPNVPTVVVFAGPSGDFITQGRRYQYTPVNSLISIDQDTRQYGACAGSSGPNLTRGGHIEVHVQESTWWTIDLASPSGQPLAPGTYSRVDRYPFCNPKVGGFDLSGDGRGCNTLTADFTIRELTLAPDGSVAHLDVRFDQSCERTGPLARGAIRYQATLAA